MAKLELTILMPCLNEAQTLPICIKKAKQFLKSHQVDGEILVADNGSSDGSQRIAEELGARVIHIEQKGYGSALWSGIKQAKGEFVIMGDSDDSYNFLELQPILEKLRERYDLVMGNRFLGGIKKGAMPFLHQYIGNPILSKLGKILFKIKINDFHCGLRGCNKKTMLRLGFKHMGMEFASEMILRASLANIKTCEVPVTLSKDGRMRKPHIRTWRDGFRHLRLLFIYSPSWLFLYPALVLMSLGITGSGLLATSQIHIGTITLNVHTLLYSWVSIIIGVDMILLWTICRSLQIGMGITQEKQKKDSEKRFTRMFLLGLLFMCVGIGGVFTSINIWNAINFQELNVVNMMRLLIPTISLLLIGIKLMSTSFPLYFINSSYESKER